MNTKKRNTDFNSKKRKTLIYLIIKTQGQVASAVTRWIAEVIEDIARSQFYTSRPAPCSLPRWLVKYIAKHPLD